MNKEEYLLRLTKSLSNYDVDDEYTLIQNYDELINEILFDNDQDFNAVIHQLGYPEILATELIDEFGFKKRENVNTEDQNKYYYKKRKRSNIFWYLLKTIAWFFQSIYLILIVSMIALFLMFGNNARLVIATNAQSNINSLACLINEDDCRDEFFNFKNEELMIAICTDSASDCNGFVVRENQMAWHNQKSFALCQGNDCLRAIHNPETFALDLTILYIVGGLTVVTLAILNQIIIINNVNQVIAKNNEYNRRRNYE